jgi:broad specificity phosphatase PhoE
MKEIAAAHEPDEHVIVASHGLTIAVCRIDYENIPIQQVYDFIPPNTEIVEIPM